MENLETAAVPAGQNSITGWANAQWNGSVQRRAAERVRAGEARIERLIAPDGYIRKSPVQKMAVPPDDHRRWARRLLRALAIGAAVLAVFMLLRL